MRKDTHSNRIISSQIFIIPFLFLISCLFFSPSFQLILYFELLKQTKKKNFAQLLSLFVFLFRQSINSQNLDLKKGILYNTTEIIKKLSLLLDLFEIKGALHI